MFFTTFDPKFPKQKFSPKKKMTLIDLLISTLFPLPHSTKTDHIQISLILNDLSMRIK